MEIGPGRPIIFFQNSRDIDVGIWMPKKSWRIVLPSVFHTVVSGHFRMIISQIGQKMRWITYLTSWLAEFLILPRMLTRMISSLFLLVIELFCQRSARRTWKKPKRWHKIIPIWPRYLRYDMVDKKRWYAPWMPVYKQAIRVLPKNRFFHISSLHSFHQLISLWELDDIGGIRAFSCTFPHMQSITFQNSIGLHSTRRNSFWHSKIFQLDRESLENSQNTCEGQRNMLPYDGNQLTRYGMDFYV